MVRHLGNVLLGRMKKNNMQEKYVESNDVNGQLSQCYLGV